MFTARDLCLFVKKQGCNRMTSSFAMTTTAMFEVECAGWEYGLVKCVCVCVRKTFSTCEIIVLYKTLKWLHGWIARIIANNVRVNVPSSNRYVTDIVDIAASNDNIKHQWFCNHRALFCSGFWFGLVWVVQVLVDVRFRIHESKNEIMFGSRSFVAIIELGFGMNEHQHR